MKRLSRVLGIIFVLSLVHCAEDTGVSSLENSSDSPELPGEAVDALTTLKVTLDGSETYMGWLYSYGIEWVPCVQERTWKWPPLLSHAWAGHSVTFDEVGEWSWHLRVLLQSESQDLIFEGPLEPRPYCGIRWLFAHGGVPANGVLSSLQVESGGEVLASVPHAWTLNLDFDEPLCGAVPGAEVNVRVPTDSWIAESISDATQQLNGRQAILNLSEMVTLESSTCP